MRPLALLILLGLGSVLTAQSGPPNILLLIGDDIGTDRVGAYAEVPDPGHTPVLDALAQEGVLFRTCWADPVCSSTRATILTGRHGFRTGVGHGIDQFGSAVELSQAEVAIPEVLPPTYRSAALGKWHLATNLGSGNAHPLLQGFEHFRGTMGILPGFISDAYYDWLKLVDDQFVHVTRYATSETVDDALALIDQFGADPWFLWVAFHAPHAPFHKPPQELHSYQLPASVQGNVPVHMKAMTEAMDTEIGRLLSSMPPGIRARTIVIFVGDNGTDKPAVTPPGNPLKAKGTVYEGGVHVPLIVSGPGVARGGEAKALVHTSDLFATIVELAGGTHSTGIDSYSIVPLLSDPHAPFVRSTLYAEIFKPNGEGPYTSRSRAARDRRYKLMQHYSFSTVPTARAFYDLVADPGETIDLLAGPLTPGQQASLASLEAVLAETVPTWQTTAWGTPGAAGIPTLDGWGSLAPHTPFGLSLAGARPGALAFFVLGAQNISLPFLGGVFVPDPLEIHLAVTDGNGALAGAGVWPPGIPPGASVLFQVWIDDPAGPYGHASTPGLAANVP